MHGGNARRGPANASFKHGKFSKALPVRLQSHFDAAIDDPALLGSRQEAALLATRMLDLVKRVETGESGQLWSLLRTSFANVRVTIVAIAAADREFAKAALESDADGKNWALEKKSIATQQLRSELVSQGELIERGNCDQAAWRELFDVIKRKVKVANAELRRLKDMQQMMSAEQAMSLIHRLYGVVKTTLSGLPEAQQDEILTNIGRQLTTIANLPESVSSK